MPERREIICGMKNLNFFFAAVLMFFSSNAVAVTLAESYKIETQKIITMLSEHHMSPVYCLGWNCVFAGELSRALESIPFVESSSIPVPTASTRGAAFYDTTTRTVYLNTRRPHPVEVRGILGLHEILGALGVHETEFELSIIASAVKEILEQPMDAQNRVMLDGVRTIVNLLDVFQGPRGPSEISSNNRFSFTIEGGVTVIGGGGSGEAVSQRIQFYKYLELLRQSCETKVQRKSIYSRFRWNAPIEVVQSNHSEVSFVFEKSAKIPRHILVPRHLTYQRPLRDPAAPNLAIEQIANYYVSILRDENKCFEQLAVAP